MELSSLRIEIWSWLSVNGKYIQVQLLHKSSELVYRVHWLLLLAGAAAAAAAFRVCYFQTTILVFFGVIGLLACPICNIDLIYIIHEPSPLDKTQSDSLPSMYIHLALHTIAAHPLFSLVM